MRFKFSVPADTRYYIARISGLDPQYRYSRSFLTEETPPPRSKKRTYVLVDGVYEIIIGIERTYLAIVKNRRYAIDADDLSQTKAVCTSFSVDLEDVFAQWFASKSRSLTTLVSVVRAMTQAQVSDQKHARRIDAQRSKELVATMTADDAFDGSCGATTRLFLSRLRSTEPYGMIAAELFSAQKASTRAKLYRRKYRRRAYAKKSDALIRLYRTIETQSSFSWGWNRDHSQAYAKWVLYVDLPQGQVSFHSLSRLCGPDYAGAWDEQHESEERILAFCNQSLGNPPQDEPLDANAKGSGLVA